ncbi:cell division protein FtsQ/DivIB [Curvibacter sp. APW13]|uniref:cell division protein FtsQ/DivIB n=1 Tax=Curvibacter sp. APW13 TaxID=3077236 RepID=UPI0028DDAEED|nr:cell division protein FtsQ/DivIB [Curvibacter sp. APW13]MDT8989795.1 cell division protein FtsQ/DivIB [Curvibacter sp. APW13]
MRAGEPTPFDIRLMNWTASVLFLVFVALALQAAAGWVVRLPVFAIRGITVVGDVSHNNPLTLRANVVPQIRGTFFTADLGQVRRAFEAVPWVRHAVVHRVFPNRLLVKLQEHQAFAYWGADSEAKLLNVQGEVFEANVGEVDQESLPRLFGPEAQSAEVLGMFKALQEVFAPLDLAVDQLEVTKSGGWHARLDSGGVLELGRGEHGEVLERTQRFVKTITQVSGRYGRWPAAVEAADLRHDNAYAIRLRGVSTVALEAPKK